MKKQLIPYIKTYLFIFISYLIISIIMALLCTFIHLSSSIYTIIIQIISYLILFLSCFYLFKQQKDNYLIHGLIYSISYLIISFIVHINTLTWTIIIKPLIIFIIFYLLNRLKKNNND
ncbi:MAG: TIGR04086 family membrane protein [Faecalibacillus sp.]